MHIYKHTHTRTYTQKRPADIRTGDRMVAAHGSGHSQYTPHTRVAVAVDDSAVAAAHVAAVTAVLQCVAVCCSE